MLKESKKKSTTKYRSGRFSLIIPVIAVIEVIILIAVSTYAWYFLNASKTLETGTITVNADSGLEIDFKDADNNTSIDIWNYTSKDKFKFEPATSVDGRNILFPTSGTFGETDTSSMTFRDATVNDINTKYLNVDFELTNESGDEMSVFLSSKSSFTVRDDDDYVNGSALRLAFYNNDGNSGKVSSTMKDRMVTTNQTFKASDIKISSESDDTVTLFYYRPSDNYTPYAYIWTTDAEASKAEYLTWPGKLMDHVVGNLFMITLPKTDGAGHTYDKVKFNNNYGWETNAFNTTNNKVYNNSLSADSTGEDISFRTIYFLKPTDWKDSNGDTPRCVLSKAASPSDSDYFHGSTGDLMTKVTTGIYSFVVPSGFDYVSFYFSDSKKALEFKALPDDSDPVDKLKDLYYFPDGGAGTLGRTSYGTENIFYYNTYGWDHPYAMVNAFPSGPSSYTYGIPMIALSGNVYFCTVPTVYLYDLVAGVSDPEKANCQVFFASEDNVSASTRTVITPCYSKYIYRALSSKTDGKYNIDPEAYNSFASNENGYAVISPGASAGFQRLANPVNEINYADGTVTSIIPTFASSIDDYIYSTDNETAKPVFKIGAGKTVNMSMIIWLEGTDARCTGENYAGNKISLYLEFVTSHSLAVEGEGAAAAAEARYTYKFVDGTRGLWTSNSETDSVTGVETKPVMQLYDTTTKRGFLMKEDTPEYYNGKSHTKIWACSAPTDLITGNHQLEFRRVNPYDEEEVWNHWQAGVCPSDGLSGGVVTFTAFADGSPDKETYGDTIVGLPELSCGGLWGNLNVSTLTVYDGRGSYSRDSLDTGTNRLSIRYDYTYPTSGTTVTVEYRVDGQWYDSDNSAYRDGFYTFSVPNNIYSRASNCQFISYTGFDKDYAINSPLNKNISVKRIWYAGSVNGKFFEFNELADVEPDNSTHTAASAGYHSYWGNDVLYVQAKAGSAMDRAFNNKFARILFYNNDSGNATGYYSYLRQNNDYKYSDGEYGAYVAVIPSDQLYYHYRLETTENNNRNVVVYASVRKGLNSNSGAGCIGGTSTEYAAIAGVADSTAHTSWLNTTYYTVTQTLDDSTTVTKAMNKNILTVEPGVLVYLGIAKGIDSLNNATNANSKYANPTLLWDYGTEVDADGVSSGSSSMIFSYNDSTRQAVYCATGVPNGAHLRFRWTINSVERTSGYSPDNASNGIELWAGGSVTDITISNGNNTHGETNPNDTFFFARRWSSMNDVELKGNKAILPHYEP